MDAVDEVELEDDDEENEEGELEEDNNRGCSLPGSWLPVQVLWGAMVEVVVVEVPLAELTTPGATRRHEMEARRRGILGKVGLFCRAIWPPSCAVHINKASLYVCTPPQRQTLTPVLSELAVTRLSCLMCQHEVLPTSS